jgi:hypothetical protein
VLVGATSQCVKETPHRVTVVNAEKTAPFRPAFPVIVLNPQPGDTCMPTLWKKFRGYEERRVILYGFKLFPSDRVQGQRNCERR